MHTTNSQSVHASWSKRTDNLAYCMSSGRMVPDLLREITSPSYIYLYPLRFCVIAAASGLIDLVPKNLHVNNGISLGIEL
jgi:hypothetical protein